MPIAARLGRPRRWRQVANEYTVSRPNQKLLEAQDLKRRVDEHSHVGKLRTLLTTGTTEWEELEYAYEIYTDAYKRAYIEALLLCTSVEETSRILEIAEGVVYCYSLMFFDASVFRDKLSKYKYVDKLPNGKEKELKRVAVSMGKEFFEWRVGKSLTLPPDEVMRRLLTDAYTMSRQVMLSGEVSRDSLNLAHRWAALATKIAGDLSRSTPKAEVNPADWIEQPKFVKDEEQILISLDDIIGEY